MSAPSPGSAGNSAGGERSGTKETLGIMPEIQEQLTALSEQRGQRAAHMAENERQRAEENGNERRRPPTPLP